MNLGVYLGCVVLNCFGIIWVLGCLLCCGSLGIIWWACGFSWFLCFMICWFVVCFVCMCLLDLFWVVCGFRYLVFCFWYLLTCGFCVCLVFWVICLCLYLFVASGLLFTWLWWFDCVRICFLNLCFVFCVWYLVDCDVYGGSGCCLLHNKVCLITLRSSVCWIWFIVGCVCFGGFIGLGVCICFNSVAWWFKFYGTFYFVL